MQKTSEIFIQNIKNLPIWVKQIITKEIFNDLNEKLEEFNELADINNLFQYMCPKVTFKGKQELTDKTMALSEGYYIFLQELIEGNNIFEIENGIRAFSLPMNIALVWGVPIVALGVGKIRRKV